MTREERQWYDAIVNAGKEAMYRGIKGEARVLLKGVLRRQPGHVGALLALAQLYERTGETGRAEALLHQAIAADPNNTEARYRLSVVLESQPDMRDRRVALYRDILRLDPDGATRWGQRASLKLALMAA